ncbi:MAG: 3'(2'),5'-bisphosphate nucleotidase CysQ [Gammaproteobacteria bacterium]|nr:3'(2'),5'-bisphosphate nucleotidase CysQ [Gammaproteobacteria bacterium]
MTGRKVSVRRQASETPNLAALIGLARELAHGAGRLALRFFREGGVKVHYKSDRSPVTAADRAAHGHIVDGLERLSPAIPVLSEESGHDLRAGRRLDWPWHWLVDPLDGTKEFVRGGKEFTVNIALIQADRPVLGVVYAPARGEMYFAHEGGGAFFDCPGSAAPEEIGVHRPPSSPIRVLCSRSHAAFSVELYDRYVGAMGKRQQRAMSSSLKFCLIARGEADIYPRMRPTSERDTAAGQAVLECAGGAVINLQSQPLRYRKPSILNPPFIACGDSEHDWLQFLPQSR